MNISPSSFSKISNVNFKANSDSSNPIEYNSASLQNNGPEIKLPLEAYLSLQTNFAFDQLEES